MITRRGFFGSMLALPGLLGLRREIGGLRSVLAIPTDVSDQDLTQFVKIRIGTGGHGHTYPGATVPFGMVQLSPDTYNVGWDWCSGYHYSDSSIMGFSHTHLSGTGVGDMLDVLLMPGTGPVKLVPGARDASIMPTKLPSPDIILSFFAITTSALNSPRPNEQEFTSTPFHEAPTATSFWISLTPTAILPMRSCGPN